MRLRCEAAPEGDLGDRCGGVGKQVLGTLHSPLENEAMRARSERRLEAPCEVPRGQPRLRRKLFQRERFAQMCVDEVDDASGTPWRQPTRRVPELALPTRVMSGEVNRKAEHQRVDGQRGQRVLRGKLGGQLSCDPVDHRIVGVGANAVSERVACQVIQFREPLGTQLDVESAG